MAHISCIRSRATMKGVDAFSAPILETSREYKRERILISYLRAYKRHQLVCLDANPLRRGMASISDSQTYRNNLKLSQTG